MSEIVEFLRARLDEDEAFWRSATGDGYADVRITVTAGRHAVTSPSTERLTASGMLREVEAKRRMIEDAEGFSGEFDTWAWVIQDDRAAGRAAFWRDSILRNLAAAYAGHPNYDSDAWEPWPV